MKRNTNIEIEKAKGDMKEEAIETFNNSFDGFRWLIKNQDFDIALSAFQLIDFSMHSKASESLKDEYKAVDEKLGELINICNENDWDLIVASDHGSAESDRKLYINAWLRKNGYLAYSKQNSSAGEDIKYKIGDLLLDLGLKDVAKKGLNIYKRITGNDPTPSNSIKDNIKLSESKAFSEFASGMNATGIYIHDERFPQGIVEDREKVAKSIKSDLEKEDFVEKVYMDEELLEIDRMPDLIVETNESVGIGSSFYPQLFHNTKAAIHNKKGLIGGIGSSFKSGVSVDAHIIDVKPTIEATLGEVSVDNQGEVIDEVLADISYEEKVDIGNIEI
jgi:predicted AlkP superfamily phosphohydrolase/phosphomutase